MKPSHNLLFSRLAALSALALAGSLVGCGSPMAKERATLASTPARSTTSLLRASADTPAASSARLISSSSVATIPTASRSIGSLEEPDAATAPASQPQVVTRVSQGDRWQLVKWTSSAGVARDPGSLTYKQLLQGRLTPAHLSGATRVFTTDQLRASFSASPTVASSASSATTAVELEAAYFPELVRSGQMVRAGDRLTVTGPGLLRFEFVRSDA